MINEIIEESGIEDFEEETYSTIKTIDKGTGAHGNELEFWRISWIAEDHVVVRDNSCCMERTYVVGQTRELNDFEKELITSVEQVINAWKNGTIWF